MFPLMYVPSVRSLPSAQVRSVRPLVFVHSCTFRPSVRFFPLMYVPSDDMRSCALTLPRAGTAGPTDGSCALTFTPAGRSCTLRLMYPYPLKLLSAGAGVQIVYPANRSIISVVLALLRHYYPPTYFFSE